MPCYDAQSAIHAREWSPVMARHHVKIEEILEAMLDGRRLPVEVTAKRYRLEKQRLEEERKAFIARHGFDPMP